MIFIPEPIQFMAEILIAELLVTYWLPRRQHWRLCLAAGLTAVLAVSLFWPSAWGGWFKMAKYLVVFLLSVGCIWATFRIRFSAALYHGAAAYAAQHIAFQLLILSYPFPDSSFSVWYAVLCYLAVYMAFYFFFVRKIRRDGLFGVDNRFFICFVVCMLSAVIVLNYIKFSVIDTDMDRGTWAITALYAILCCLFALFIQSGMYRQSKLSHQLEIAEHLLHSQEQQYKVSEATIQCINLKCHDLKHQISAIRRSMSDATAKEALGELESAVQIYDSSIKTGNNALDIILTEKSLLCEQRKIQLTCMADASGLVCFSDSELYSLFGNLLDTAIESVQSLKNQDLRTIGLTVRTTGSMTLIHTENYFEHAIKIEDGLPLTTKKDTQYHGFGMQSIRLICQRHGGTLSVQIDGNIFNVNILLPSSMAETDESCRK